MGYAKSEGALGTVGIYCEKGNGSSIVEHLSGVDVRGLDPTQVHQCCPCVDRGAGSPNPPTSHTNACKSGTCTLKQQ